MPDDPDTTPSNDDDDVDHEHGLQHVLDELREMPAGMNDPNIIGDAGPLDVPPGSDPPEEGQLEE
ncbi:MAG: hypothetical protein QOG87_2166 [Actinomycetota bacterium]|jgi:hypothetical protein